MNEFRKLKVALVHHWLVTRRGGEKVFEAIAELFPEADIYTLVSGGKNLFPSLRGRAVHSSILQKLPCASRWYPYYLPFFPAAASRLDLTSYDLVISSDAAVAKGVRVNPSAFHICYCHTPMRYVWTGYGTYRDSAGPLSRIALPAVRSWLCRWDYSAAQKVTLFIANSGNVQKRIRDCYGRESIVIYPPVDVESFAIRGGNEPAKDYFLVVSQLVPYKRVDLIVKAFNACGKKLLVIGDGPERGSLERSAKPNIQFLGAQPEEDVVRAMQDSKAFVFAGEEDFGIVIAEAQACGKPVIAYAKGGANEIVLPGKTGIFFESQSVASILHAIEQFETAVFDTSVIRSSAVRFGRERFLREFSTLCRQTLGDNGRPCLAEKTSVFAHP